jgi:hypothetical protein
MAITGHLIENKVMQIAESLLLPDLECVTMEGVLDWKMDLLTTYIHDSEIQAITAPPLISTIHKLPQHPLSLFHSVMSLPAVPWQRHLTVEILQLHAHKSSIHRLPYRTDWVDPITFKITPLHGPRRNTPFPTVRASFRVDLLLREIVYQAVA